MCESNSKGFVLGLSAAALHPPAAVAAPPRDEQPPQRRPAPFGAWRPAHGPPTGTAGATAGTMDRSPAAIRPLCAPAAGGTHHLPLPQTTTYVVNP